MTQFYPYPLLPPTPPSVIRRWEAASLSLPPKRTVGCSQALDQTHKSAFSHFYVFFFSFLHFVCPSLHLSAVSRWNREQSPRQLRCKFRQTNPIKSWPHFRVLLLSISSHWTVMLKARLHPQYIPPYLQDLTSVVTDGLTYTLFHPHKPTLPPCPPPSLSVQQFIWRAANPAGPDLAHSLLHTHKGMSSSQ